MQNRAEILSAEADEVAEQRQRITDLSNITLQLYSWYINNGHARNDKDEEGVKAFFIPTFQRAWIGAAAFMKVYTSAKAMGGMSLSGRTS